MSKATTDGKTSPTSTDDEKGRIEADERLTVPVYEDGIDTSGIDERKLIKKLDYRLIPWLSFLYLLSFLDRTSIGNAKVRVKSQKSIQHV